ncbi:MAG: trypsin-like peptidase domain-containing protein [Phycisphaerales bacterium]|nr:trypsin-like peptidase domain-containing protein [Phycisphaerales bacterium]
MQRMRHHRTIAAALFAASTAATSLAQNMQSGLPSPSDELFGTMPRTELPSFRVPDINWDSVAQLEAQDSAQGLAPRYAVPFSTDISTDTHGFWEQVTESTMVWRMRVTCDNALSLNFGFDSFHMPEGASLYLYDASGDRAIRPFTSADNAAHGQLWTPPTVGNDVVIELTIPVKAAEQLKLHLGVINAGYREFNDFFDPRSGSCNVDVVCPEGDDWRAEIASVAVISTGGSRFCTGFMVNNALNDETPYFMTAYHCGITAGNAASLVTFWNYETSVCEGTPDGQLTDFQSGSFFRAAKSSSDFTLVELDQQPDPDWMVSYAGWDNTGVDSPGAIAIHHPNTDEKRISFEYQPTSTTSYLGATVPGDGTHVRVTDWDIGTTEPGSSGSPLFDVNHRIIGQLHGGYAACGNDDSDWYGKFSVSWTGSSSSNRLSDWLDPAASGATTADTLWPGASGILVSPGGVFTAEGQAGGPFTPGSQVYTIRNMGDVSLDYLVSTPDNWLTITNGVGTIPASAQADVTVTINSNANGFPNGGYNATVSFANTTDHDGDTTRPVKLFVGVPEQVYIWNLDTNPGWTTQGQWAYGTPTGGGGEHGNNDPTSGATGTKVYGYNLNGDYTNNMPEYHLTTTAIDCSDLSRTTLKFKRFLNVEQPAYDHASIRVSNNGSTWTDVWTNGGEITDASWQAVEHDISAVADGHSTVYIRWTMGTTDSSWLFSGWNIDDVAIWGVSSAECVADFNGDGSVNTLDVLSFLNAWNAGDSSADINDDGNIDTLDVLAFLNLWNAGC